MRPARAALVLVALAAILALALVLRGRERRDGALAPSARDAETAAPSAEPPFVSTELEAAIVAERTPAELAAAAGLPGKKGLPEDVESAAPSERARLRVTLTWGEDGAPAEGVSTKVVTWGAPDPLRDTLFGLSDARGVFELEELHPGTVGLYVDRGGHGAAELVAGETAELAIEIPAGIELTGRVLGPDGAPVPHAAVFLSDYGNSSDGQVVTAADGAGNYHLRGVGDGRCVAAFAKGFAPSPCVDVEGDPGEGVQLDLVLPELGAALEGVVRGPDGRELAGARVLVGSEHARSGSSPPRALVTDDAGRFVAEGLAPGMQAVAVRSAGGAPWSGQVELRVGERDRIEVRLEAGAVIQGQVLDAAGAPVAGVFVGVGRYGDFLSTQTRSAPDGSYRLAGLAPGSVAVRASDRERGKASAQLTLTPGVDTRWDARLEAGGPLAGTVVDEGGTALAGWSVRTEAPGQHGSWSRSVRTDASGRFRLDNCPQEAFHLGVYPPDGRPFEPALVVTEFELGDTELVLRVPDDERATAWVTGWVVGPDGERPSAARIISWSPGAHVGIPHEDIDEQGRFRVGPFKRGAQRLVFSSRDLAKKSVEVEGLSAGEERELGVVRLEEPGALVVHLSRSDGAPVDRSAWISVDPIGGAGRQFVSHEDGVGRAETLAPGTWIVRAQGMEVACAVARVELRAGSETRVDLLLEPGTAAVVALSLPAGAAPERARVRVIDEAGEAVFDDELAFEADTAPTFVVPGLRIGTYRVEVTTGAGLSGGGELAVESLEFSPTAHTVELR